MYKILCVEDEIDFREDIVEYLRMQKFEVLEASNGRQAKEILRTTPNIDLVLCDVMMPDMDGPELLRDVRKLRDAKQLTPFVFLSALSDKHTVVQGKEWGCDEYLTKPIDFEVLVATIRSCIGRHRAANYVCESVRMGLHSRIEHFVEEEIKQPLDVIQALSDQVCGLIGNQGGSVLEQKVKQLQQMTRTQAQRARQLSEILRHTPKVAPNLTKEGSVGCEGFVQYMLQQVYGTATPTALQVVATGSMDGLPLRELTLASSMLLEAARTRNAGQKQGLITLGEERMLTIDIADVAEHMFDETLEYTTWTDSTNINTLHSSLQHRIMPLMYAERLVSSLKGEMSMTIVNERFAIIRMQFPKANAGVMSLMGRKSG